MIQARKIIAENLALLMEYEGIKQLQLAARTGISQRTVSNLLAPDSTHSSTLDTLTHIAEYFGIEIYHLLIPNLPVDELLDKRLEQIVDCYAALPPPNRDAIRRAALAEARAYRLSVFDHVGPRQAGNKGNCGQQDTNAEQSATKNKQHNNLNS